jgi:RNA-directed DNA polymerase
MSALHNKIALELGVPTKLVDDAVNKAHTRYRKILVKKKSGGIRLMIQPAAELKLVLAWINKKVLKQLPVSSIATAFESGTSIVKNAKAHRNSLYSVRVDIEDFFASIRSDDLLVVLDRKISELPGFLQLHDLKTLITRACFDRNDRLPIGYSTSPKIANVVMYELDKALIQMLLASPKEYGQFALTRYADDFLFSTDLKGASKKFVTEFKNLLMDTTNPRLEINQKKTRMMSRNGGSTLITGLRVNSLGGVGVHPTYRDHVRLLLKLFSLGRLKADEKPSLCGHLAFIENADPRLFTRLAYRYHAEIAKIRN